LDGHVANNDVGSRSVHARRDLYDGAHPVVVEVIDALPRRPTSILENEMNRSFASLLVFAAFAISALPAQILLPNLTVTRCSVSPTQVLPGQVVAVDYDVRNTGQWGTAEYWGDAIRFNNSPSLNGATTLLAQPQLCRDFPNFILPGQYYSTFGANWTVFVAIPNGISPGTYYIGYDCNITRSQQGPCTGPWPFGESTYTDNQRWARITVGSTGSLPDFTISNLSVAPATGLPGSSATVSFHLNNVGGSINPGSITAGVYLSSTTAPAGPPLAQTQFVVVSSGSSIPFALPITIPAVPYCHYQIVVFADDQHFVAESNENNNTASVPFGVGVSAGVTPYGQGCGGPAEPTIAASPLPQLGSTVDITVCNVLQLSITSVNLGFSATSSLFGPLPLPLDPFGMTGCSLLADPVVSDILFSGTATCVTRPLIVPDICDLIDRHVYTQAFTQQPGANPLGIVASPALDLHIGL